MPLDADALAGRYQLHRAEVLGLCRRLLGSTAHAEDAAHEVFLRVLRHHHEYDAERPFAAWALTIATRYCIDQLRRRSAEAKLFGDEDVERAAVRCDAPSPLAAILDRERRHELQRAVASLPAKYRVPLVLSVYLERTYAEIGAVLGVPRSHVAVLIFRAKQLLRQALSARSLQESLGLRRTS
jgi:RNA polymerase sigma-70 factor (ECF subfamily)